MERGPRSGRRFALVQACILGWAAACGGDPEGGQSQHANMAVTCLPGIQVACPCPDGVTQGVQVCDPTGAMLGACDCGTAAPAGGAIASPAGGSGGIAGGLPTAGSAGDLSGAGALGGSAGDLGGAGDGGGGGLGGAGAGAAPARELARDLRIKEVAIYQAVKVSLSNAGAPVIARNAPVIVGKEALLRVFIEPAGAALTPRMIEVELTLESSEGPAASQTVTQMVSTASSDATLASTINFNIPGEHVTGDLKYAVALREVGASASGTADPAARFPTAEGELIALGARDAGPLRVMVVPYRYQGDGSGRLPAMDDAQIDLFRRYLHSYYPASQIELTVHEPVDYNGQVGPNTGWEQWLDFHCSLRNSEDPDPKVLYYGVMSPRASQREYGGGIYGISPVPNPAANYGRCSVGVGFQGAAAASTMAHELGHSLGLPHAPCGVDGGPYPYPQASIGVWGYSLAAQELRDPARYKDLMSYCDPAFISDYNFERLFERIRYLNLQFDEQRGAPVRYARVLRDGRGALTLRGYVTLSRAPAGEEDARAVTLLDAAGEPLADPASAYFIPFSEEETGLWLVPAPEHGKARSVRLGAHTVVLR